MFEDTVYFVTPGASYTVKLLEFISYRGNQVSLLLLLYFILLSISSVTFILMNKNHGNKKKMSVYYAVFVLIMVLLLLYISNSFFLVYIGLTLLAFVVSYAAIQISIFLWGKTTTYDQGDVVYESSFFETENGARQAMQNKLNELNQISIDDIGFTNLKGEVTKVDEAFYFTIIAQNVATFSDLKKEN